MDRKPYDKPVVLYLGTVEELTTQTCKIGGSADSAYPQDLGFPEDCD